MARKKHAKPQQAMSRTPPGLVDALIEVEGVMRGKRWAEARDRLEALHQRFPGRRDVLALLFDAYEHLGDQAGLLRTIERLHRLVPNDPDYALALAGAYSVNVYPFLALRAFRDFLRRWPEHEEAAHARQSVANLEDIVPELLRESGLSGKEGFELATEHEQARYVMEQGRSRDARQALEKLLKHHPNFIPVLNNLGIVYAAEGRTDEAIATARRSLALDPNYLHALANLVWFLVQDGRLDEAREAADRVKAMPPNRDDVWVKKAEALSYLGEDQAVLDVYDAARVADKIGKLPPDALLEHLAGVAAARLGKDDAARRHWETALKIDPGLEVAEQNLADSRRPPGERHGPWAFPLRNWLPEPLIAESQRAAERGSERAASGLRRFVKDFPQLERLAPLLLDRGNPMAAQFIVLLAGASKAPGLLAAVRDFALGQRGSDQLRQQAMTVAQEGGVFPTEPVQFWTKGEWHEILPLSFDINDKPVDLFHHAPEVRDWLAESIQATNAGEAAKAEELLRRALVVEPDQPDLLYNLTAVYTLLGRDREAEEIQRQLYREHPDYFFARIGMARILTREGKYDEAMELLNSLLRQNSFHRSEFAALAMAEIELQLARNEREGARSWLAMFESIDPEHPALDALRRQVEGGFLGAWSRLHRRTA
jgi:tetratricopeptide (TPR) repeat protein